jgi:hypothetical protein
MDENDSSRRDRRQDHSNFKSTLVTRFLTPIAAAAASAAAGYAAKKAPDFFERTLLPRLRSLAGDAGDVTRDLPAKAASVASSAASVASSAGDVAQDLADHAKSLVSVGTQTSNGSSRSRPSLQEIEKRRDERTRARAERRGTKAR